jgi:cytochrome c peroxidase
MENYYLTKSFIQLVFLHLAQVEPEFLILYQEIQGHMAETDDLSDAYRFRTPMLRNVKLSAPYGHNGAYPDLKGIIKHHLNPKKEKGLWNKNT